MPRTPQPVLAPEDTVSRAVEERLREAAGRFGQGLQERVLRLLLSSAVAVTRLADLDLVRHESGGEEGGHTLALWEELAPVMGSTVGLVNERIAAAGDEFRAPPERESGDDLDAAFGPARPGDEEADPGPQDPELEIGKLVSAVCSGMRRDVAHLGERLRNPQVVSDPWMLISDLLEFRGRVRAGLGELIYQVCSFVAEVDREDVVPGYGADLEMGLVVRQATSNLAFLFRGHTKRIGAAGEDRVVAALQDALKDLHAYSRTRALPFLRTADKRIFLETRATLYQLLRNPDGKSREIKNAVENLARFLDSMSVVSRRENLRLHDRAQLAKAGRHLEAAHSNLALPEVARIELSAAVLAAGRLYGRDPQLDAYLRAQRHFPAEWLHDPEIAVELEKLAALLAGIAPP